jgi:hypothetical protein
MERSKTTRRVVLMAVSLGTGGMILTSLFGVLDLVKSPTPTQVKAPASSQNAQVEAQENGYLAVLKKEPKNTTAIGGMEKVVQYYMQTGNEPKIVASLEKLIAAAPQAERVQEYKKVLDTIKKAPAPAKKEK